MNNTLKEVANWPHYFGLPVETKPITSDVAEVMLAAVITGSSGCYPAARIDNSLSFIFISCRFKQHCLSNAGSETLVFHEKIRSHPKGRLRVTMANEL